MNEVFNSQGPALDRANRFARTRSLLFAMLAMTARFLSPLSAQTPVTILNFSFEDPTPTSGDNFASTATNWTSTNGPTVGTFDPAIARTGPAPAPGGGSQWGFADSGAGLRQVLSGVFAANQLYTFSVDMGYRGDQTGTATGSITLGYINPGTNAFTTLSAQSGTFNPDTYSLVTGSYQTGVAELGLPIAIQLTNIASNQVLFDQVQLTVTAIPESSAFACALGAGALGLAWSWRQVRLRRVSAPAAETDPGSA